MEWTVNGEPIGDVWNEGDYDIVTDESDTRGALRIYKNLGVKDAFDENCAVCSMSEMCYAKKQCDMQDIYEKTAVILHGGALGAQKLSEMLLDKCIRSKEIADYINREYSSLVFTCMRSNRTRSLAGQYNAMSHLIKSTEKQAHDNGVRDIRLERVISAALKKVGMVFSDVLVFGKRTKDIEVHSICADKIPFSSRQLSEYLTKECGIRISEPSFDISDRADMIMRLKRECTVEVEYAKSSNAKSTETFVTFVTLLVVTSRLSEPTNCLTFSGNRGGGRPGPRFEV